MLRCFWCIVDYDIGEIIAPEVRPAVTIYQGFACCEVHLNTKRGQPVEYGYAATYHSTPEGDDRSSWKPSSQG